jgi:ABC-type glycerol-3-phosphate transport system substrate-binding protein
MTRIVSRRALFAAAGVLVSGPLAAACGAGGGAGDAGSKGAAKQPVKMVFESYSSGGGSGGSQGEFGNWEQVLARTKEKYPHLSFEATFIGGMSPGSYDRWTSSGATAATS